LVGSAAISNSPRRLQAGADMADLTIIAWNIEKFGAFAKLKLGPGAETWINGTLAAIALVVNQYQADILVIQEFRKPGAAYLPRLQTFLNGDGTAWSFDYLPGAFKEFTSMSDVTNSSKLDYTARANTEGYAVFWKTDALTAFTDVKMSTGQNGDTTKNGYINLLLAGSGPAYAFDKDPEIVPDGKGFANPALFPAPDSKKIANSSHDPLVNNNVLQFATVRRPCWIKVNSSKYSKPVPVIVYHAPADTPSCLYGALACGLLAQVGQSSSANVILAGDFNLTLESQFNTVSTVYSGLALNNGTKNKTNTGEFGFARTQTQYQKIAVRPAALVDEDGTYEHPRDVLFYRNTIANPLSGVIDVVANLMAENTFSKAVFAEANIKAAVLGALASTDAAYQLPDLIRASAGLVAAVKAPFAGTSKAFATALAATVFYRCFVSDHLPVSFTITD
jgi:hypothetical protein